jgi:hypothetical protein
MQSRKPFCHYHTVNRAILLYIINLKSFLTNLRGFRYSPTLALPLRLR